VRAFEEELENTVRGLSALGIIAIWRGFASNEPSATNGTLPLRWVTTARSPGPEEGVGGAADGAGRAKLAC
jgi:hypothetical protein